MKKNYNSPHVECSFVLKGGIICGSNGTDTSGTGIQQNTGLNTNENPGNLAPGRKVF